VKALKIGLLSLMLAPAFASNANAFDEPWRVCYLERSYSPVARGYWYGFNLRMAVNNSWPYSHEQPWQWMPLTLYWHGTKNYVKDTPPGGAYIMTLNTAGFTYGLGTWTNPWDGSWSGRYERWVEVKDKLGRTYCISNVAQIDLL
jgi:hypothetical protein